MEVCNGIAMGYPVENFPGTKRYGDAAVDHHDNEARELGGNRVCGFVCAALLVLFVGFVVILIVMNYGKDPPEFRVDSVSVTPLNLSAENPLLAANWNVDFFVRNPSSGEGFYYSKAEASVLYGQFTLAWTSIIPFTHDVEDQRNLQVSMAAASVPIAGELVTEWRSGRVNVTVAVDCLVRVIDRESSGQGGQRQHMRVSCDGVEVGFSPNATVGRLIGGPTPCRVHLKSPSF